MGPGARSLAAPELAPWREDRDVVLAALPAPATHTKFTVLLKPTITQRIGGISPKQLANKIMNVSAMA